MILGITGQIVKPVVGGIFGGILFASQPGNSCREFLHTESGYLRLYPEGSQDIYS